MSEADPESARQKRRGVCFALSRDSGMDDGLFLWQGGHKVEIERKTDLVTLEGASIERAFDVASAAGVEVADVELVQDDMVMMRLRGDRERAMAAIRAQGEALRHVYGAKGSPDDEIVVGGGLYVGFRAGMSQARQARGLGQ